MQLELSAMSVRGEPIEYADAIRREFTPIEIGHRWGPPWSTTWFHVTGHVPDSWSGKRVVAEFDLGFAGSTGFTCEALAWRGGRPWSRSVGASQSRRATWSGATPTPSARTPRLAPAA